MTRIVKRPVAIEEIMGVRAATKIQIWPIDRLIPYPRNPRKNDAAADRMCGSIREFGFKIPVLARSDGEVVDGLIVPRE